MKREFGLLLYNASLATRGVYIANTRDDILTSSLAGIATLDKKMFEDQGKLSSPWVRGTESKRPLWSGYQLLLVLHDELDIRSNEGELL